MTHLEQLYTEMVETAPVFIPESNKAYILELARTYTRECCKASLERAAQVARIGATIPKGMDISKLDTEGIPVTVEDVVNMKLRVSKESITSPDNITLL